MILVKREIVTFDGISTGCRYVNGTGCDINASMQFKHTLAQTAVFQNRLYVYFIMKFSTFIQ